MRRAVIAAVGVVGVLCASCGGGSQGASASGTASASGGSGGSGGEGGGSSAAPGGNFEGAQRRSGLQIHIEDVSAAGALPDEENPRFDRLNVSFQLVLDHNGTEPLSGVRIEHARLVHDDGREITFGIMGDGWDGRLEVGAHRAVMFHKTPDSASPPPNHHFCGLQMRLEVSVELAGRTARATSRRVPVRCAEGAPAP